MSLLDPVQQACDSAGRLAQAGAPRGEVLECLARAAEVVCGPRSTASILVLDESGLLRNGASPRLPDDYLRAIDGLRPDAAVGTCAAAAATGCTVVTPDFCADTKWAELRHLPLALGYVAAWSMPIMSEGKVLGTFGTYYRDPREPSDGEREAVARLAAAAASVLRPRPR